MAIQQVRCGKNLYKVEVLDEAGASVAAEIFKHKEYRRAEEAIKSTRDAIVDVGAHVGLFALYCRSLNNECPIICLEPESKNFSALQNNLSQNKITHTVALKAALAHVSGRRQLQVSTDSHNHVLFPENICRSDKCELVETVSLGALIKKFHIQKIGLLKMDIEGTEKEILESLSPSDFKLISSIIMEYHDIDGAIHRELEKLLRENGFAVEIFPSKFEKHLGFIFARNKRA